MKLIEYLNQEQLSPDEFAQLIGVDRQTIYALLCGNRARLDTAIKIVEKTQGLVDYKDLDRQNITKKKCADDHNLQ